MKQKIGTEALKKVRERHEFHYQKRLFCESHNMKLEAILHGEIEKELRIVERILEDSLGLDRIPFPD